jgi:xylan 1,4-beta-xylosidase
MAGALVSFASLVATAHSARDPVPAANEAVAVPVAIRVDAGKPLADLKPIWPFLGTDEPDHATMKDGKALTRR